MEEGAGEFRRAARRIVRIGLTREQVDALDSERLRQGIEVKPSDSRAESYIDQYGDRCWETDVLPGAVIEEEIGNHIRSWLDAKLWKRRHAEIERARELLCVVVSLHQEKNMCEHSVGAASMRAIERRSVLKFAAMGAGLVLAGRAIPQELCVSPRPFLPRPSA